MDWFITTGVYSRPRNFGNTECAKASKFDHKRYSVGKRALPGMPVGMPDVIRYTAFLRDLCEKAQKDSKITLDSIEGRG
jgi:hypothetical protein